MAPRDCVGEELSPPCFRLCRGLCASPRLSLSEGSMEGLPGPPHPSAAPQPAARSQSDVNNTPMNMGVQVVFEAVLSVLWGCVPRSGIAGSCGSSMFNFLSNCYTVFYRGCTILHSHPNCSRCNGREGTSRCGFNSCFSDH